MIISAQTNGFTPSGNVISNQVNTSKEQEINQNLNFIS